jgi:3-hexulose-6-phosphate synthase/6-phospho-3-hexuloisomerase
MTDQPVLQVALDMLNMHRAIQIAHEAVEGGVDWIEAGTPLIKSEGVEVLRKLKDSFPDKTLVADLKTMDTGGFECELATKAGADVICIMGVASDSTISEAIKSARRYGSRIMVDLMGVKDKLIRAKQVVNLGADFVCLHVGIDEQMSGHNPLEIIEEVASEISVPVAVAGGINSETAVDVISAGASVVIVGGAIIKAPDVVKATSSIKEAILERKTIHSDLYKKYSQEEIFDAFVRVSAPNIADASHTKGCMVGIIPRIKHGLKMIGKAVTVRTMDGDWAKAVEAIDRAKKGEVIVIDACGGHTAVWGELASWSCKTKGIAGVVIDGAARDIDDIIEMDFPFFSKHIAPNAGEPKGYGEIGSEITCGGQTVRAGDWIVGDESGIVVIHKENAQEIANRSLDIRERENRLREEIKRGSTLSQVLKLEKWEKVG